LAQGLRGRGAKGTGPSDSRDPGPAPVALVGTWSGEDAGVGRQKALCWEWLMRGVRVAATAGRADRHAGVSGMLGRSFGRASWAGQRAMQGWFVGQAGRASCEAFFFSFLFLFYFSSSLFEFKFDLEFEFKSGVPYSLDF